MRLLLPTLLLLSLATPALAQGQIDRDHVPSEERVDIRERRQTDIDGNAVRTTIFNFGQSGRTTAVPDEIPYEWPKNTRRHYIALTGLFVGAEVTSVTGETAYIVDIPNYREDLNDENNSWTFAPLEGYTNPADEDLGIARSDRPETWPPFWPDKLDAPTDPGWPGSWNGYFGRDVFNADQEVFYRMGDDEYDRNRINESTTYYPDSTDLSRAGLGLLVDTRILQWSQVLIDDAVFILHAVKNDGTQDLQKVGVTLWLADLVGGDPDADDDAPSFDLLLDTAFLGDSDGRSNDTAFPSGQSVGAAIAFFLESPGNATDRIDNDGDGTTADVASEINTLGVTAGEPGGPVIDLDFIQGEGADAPNSFRFDGIDNNGNGVIDEDSTYAAFGMQAGVGFADYIDNDNDGEPNSPTVTQAMIDEAAGDTWGRWPAIPGPYDGQPVWLIDVGPEDLGLGFRDNIDNDEDGTEDAPFPLDYLAEPGSPVVTQAMIDAAASDAPYFRYAVPGTDIVLYDVKSEDLGKPYADGIDNDEDGAVDEGIDEGIDEMIDERRDDGIDNDGDWRSNLDDVGLDGAEGTGDPGENDGVPTTGAGTELPGESNIDVTDVSESDQIGITNVKYEAAGSIQYQTISDGSLFTRFMVPGQFTNLIEPPSTDSDLFVSSGTFPLRAGQTERVSFAVILGDVDYNFGPNDPENRYSDLLRKRQSAQEAYEADYRFAQAPICPNVTVVPGDGQVSLYWDTIAEDETFDTFVADLPYGLDPRDFEGYKVYRATDPAFLDAQVITDGFGNIQFLQPIAQFDLINEFGEFHPVDVQGTRYYLGNNTRNDGEAGNGLTHTFTDSTAVNGITYYYAVASYDHGAYIPGEVLIAPSECPIRIRQNPDGTVETGPNVVEVTPSQEAAGYVDATLGDIERVRGFATGEIGYEIVDPEAIENGHRYRLTFSDTLLVSDVAQDTLTTAGFTLEDLTDQDTLLAQSETFRPGRETPVTDGFRLLFEPVTFPSVIDSLTVWEDTTIYGLEVERFTDNRSQGVRFPADYRVEIGEVGFGRSTEFTIQFGIPRTLPERETNVRVFKRVIGPNGQEVEEPVDYAFYELIPENDPTGTTPVMFQADTSALGGNGESDRLILLEELPNGEVAPTWQVFLNARTDREAFRRNPSPGDEGQIRTQKPFLAGDIYEFTARGPELDEELAASVLDDVKVVPNPYRGTNRMEPQNPFSTGRGPRVLRFINVPPRCTIRIFTVSGRPVKTLEHNVGSNEGLTAEELRQGSVAWDLLTDENLSVSYGVYIYHLDAPGIGETTGTFTIIK